MKREHDEMGSVVGDARKRQLLLEAELLEEDRKMHAWDTSDRLPPNHDEQHAHLHEWPDYDDH